MFFKRHRNSLKFKLLVSIAIILVLSIGISGWFLFQKAQAMMLNGAWNEMNSSLRQQSESITRYLDGARHDAIILSHAPNIQKILDSLEDKPDHTNQKNNNLHLELANQFAHLIEEKGYLQIRLIDVQSGMEVVRVDRPDANTLIPVNKPVDQLQYKGDSKYVQQGALLNHDEIYISDINLNREFGEIIKPFQPTQRFVVGVFEEHLLSHHKVDIYKLIEHFRHFDQELSTASIRAVQTGNLFWREHYNYIVPRLDIALKKAKTFLNKDLHYLIDRIDKANTNLIRKEEAAFDLAALGLSDKGEYLILSDEYRQQKREYRQAIEDLLKKLNINKENTRRAPGPRALIVINTNFQDVLSSFEAQQTHETVLTNSKGQFLFHKDESQQFAFEFNDDATTLEDVEGKLWTDLVQGIKSQPHFDHHGELHVSKRLFFSNENSDRFLGLVLAKQKDKVLEPIYELSTFTAYTSLTVILISLVIVLLIISNIIRPISTLTEQATSIAKGDLQRKLPVFENIDEVGRLTRAFTRLIDKLQAQSQATEVQAREVEALNNKLEERITERTAALNSATQRAEAASQAKTEFLATMSHEIRTPMNGMLGMAQLLSETNLNKIQQDYISTIVVSGDNLLSIIDDILDFSKIEAGKLELEPIKFDMREVIRDILKLMNGRAKEKEIQLLIKYPSKAHCFFLGDPGRIRQIIINLVGNAIKFTPQGKVEISVEVNELDDCKSRLCISVTDSGIGISSDNQAKLFKAFQQADSSTTRQFGGTGLGLAICKKLVDLMAGDIGCNSEPDKGSSFWFCIDLPRADKTNTDQANSQSSADRESLSIPLNSKVLLVEDNHINQLVATTLLESLELEHEVAENGIAAISKWKRGDYDLILMDCLMPEMDGYEATRQIRALEKEGEHIPIIAVTANVLPSDQEACKEAGMDDFVSKPLDFNLLKESLARWLN